MNFRRNVEFFCLLGLLGAGEVGWTEGGVVQNGLQLELVPLQEEFILGQPMKFRLEVINRKEEPVKVAYTADDIQGDDFLVYGPEDFQVVYKGSGEYPAKDFTLHVAGRSRKVLIHARDLNKEYSIGSPGRYTVQYVQKIWDHTSTQFPPSNTVEISILKSKE